MPPCSTKGNVSFHCKFCSHRCLTIRNHLLHLRNHRNLSKYYFCGYGHCTGSFSTEMAFRCHVIRNHRIFVAPVKSAYQSAAAPINEDGKYECPVGICGEQFLVHMKFVKHLKCHLKSGTPLPCPYRDCVSEFKQWSSLTGHVHRKHRSKNTTAVEPNNQLRFALDPAPAESSLVEEPLYESQECAGLSEILMTDTPNDSVVALAQFYQRLEYKHMVPASVTQVVAEEMKSWCSNLTSSFLTNLSLVLESEGLSSETISDIVTSMNYKCDMMTTCNALRTVYMRKKFYQKNFSFLELICVPLENGSFFYYVPIEETIKACFACKSWNFSMDGFPPSADGLLRDFYDGEVYKNNRFTQENPVTVVLILYQDGFELVCAIGPAKNYKHKLIGIYMAFGNLAPEVRFKRDSIQLVGLVKQMDFNHKEVYGVIVSDLLRLQESGVDLPNFGNVKVQVPYIAGDNLGSHGLGGFVENFSKSTYFCRFCELTRMAFRKPGGETRRFKARTPESYYDALTKVKVDPTTGVIKSHQGVKFDSEFNKLKGFHVCSPGLVSCIAHDLAEGVICFDLKLFIQYFVSKGWFDLPELNDLMEKFPYSVEDRKDLAPKIKKLEKKRLSGSAWQIFIFLRLFPLIVFGHVKDFKDPVWKCMLLLREISATVLSPDIHVSHLPGLQCLINEYLMWRLKLFPNVKLRPKHHYLWHYPELFYFFGSLLKCFTLRFESKHCFFIRSWRSSNNSINILQTLAFKHEYLQSWVRSGGGMSAETVSGARRPIVTSMYSDEVVSALRKSVPSLQLEECDSISIKGTAYKKDNVVILAKMNFGALLAVGTIHLILVDLNENVYFLVKRGTASLVQRYGVFLLNAATHFECVKSKDLLSYYPLTPYMRDSKPFLALRHALVTDELQ